MLKIRRPLGRLIFNMGIAIPGKTVFLIETAPCCFFSVVLIFFSVRIVNGIPQADTVIQHTTAETKRTPFNRRHFQKVFCEWKLLLYDNDNESNENDNSN